MKKEDFMKKAKTPIGDRSIKKQRSLTRNSNIIKSQSAMSYYSNSRKGRRESNTSQKKLKSHKKPDLNQTETNVINYLPDLGNLKQGLERPSDMEVEERAMMNLYAKDFDELKLLEVLNNNQDLYQHKLEQYK